MLADRLQERLVALRHNKLFEFFVIGVIIFSALIIGAKTYHISPQLMNLFELLDLAVTVFFLLEIIIRMRAERGLVNFFKK